MSFLIGHKAVVLGRAADGALARLLRSFGAELVAVDHDGLMAALADASFLVEFEGLEALRRRFDTTAVPQRVVHVSVSAFGSHGPKAGWRGGELVASAAGGALRVTGEPDGAPVKEALDACWFHAEMVAAAGAMAAHLERADTGLGQHVDVSVQEVALNRNVSGVLGWQFDRRKLHRVGGALNYGRATVRCIWELADGYCFHSLMTGRFGAPANKALSDWIDEAGLPNPMRGVDWLTYNRSTLPAETRAVWEEAITAFFRTRTKAEIAGEGRRRGINATVVNEPADVLEDAHLKARGFLDRGEPTRFVRVVDGPTAAPRPKRSGDRPGPLAGLRVLDFSWALVGSITTKTLGDLGAEVVKVESRGRPCLSRLDVQVKASRPDSFDDKPWFAHLNSSKKSLALDMKRPESREVLDPLIDWADVVVENFSPGTMAKLGLDYAALSARNPGLVMVSGSVYGQTGPLAQEWGVDGTGAALGGRTYLTGWPDRGPVIPGSVPYGDVIVPFVMAAAVAAGVERQRRTGMGCHIDAAMYEICVQQTRDALVAAARGERPRRMGNDAAGVALQGVFPAVGEDRWVAVTLFDGADRARFEAATGIPAEASAIAAWTTARADREIEATLQAAGIACAILADAEDLLERDPQIAARGALVALDHPILGTFGHVRTPVSFSRAAVRPYRAPGLGEHSAAVARDIAGLSAERIATLETLGVFR